MGRNGHGSKWLWAEMTRNRCAWPFYIGIMGGTQKIACHSEGTQGRLQKEFVSRRFALNSFAGWKHNYEANQVHNYIILRCI